MIAPPLWLLSVGGWLKSAAAGVWRVVTTYPRTSAAIAACVLAWFAHGWDLDRKLAAQRQEIAAEQKRKDEAVRALHREQVAEYVVGMSARNAQLQAERDAARGAIRTEIKYIKERTRDYITPLAVSRCIVTRGFVLHHDAAWTGNLASIPRSPGSVVDEPSGVPLDRVGDINADNAETCRKLAVDLEVWDKWYDREHAAWEAFRAKRAAGVKP